jgi:hypothetical protein
MLTNNFPAFSYKFIQITYLLIRLFQFRGHLINSSEHTFVQFYVSLKHVYLVFVLKNSWKYFMTYNFHAFIASCHFANRILRWWLKSYIICCLEFEIQICNLQGPPFSPSNKEGLIGTVNLSIIL